jgi:gamma-glutamyltranspeptidase/glutathione hydrolase
MLRSSAPASCPRALAILTLACTAALIPSKVRSQTVLFPPERQSVFEAKPLARASRQIVATANPLAASAGLEVLREGGSAADAAIAVQLVLGLVEPQSSGLGGGAFLLHWDATTRSLVTYDGREVAPAAARPDRFLEKGRPIPFAVAVRSPLSIGVPGTVRLLEHIHQRHGRLPWRRLVGSAVAHAEAGFPVSRRLSLLLGFAGPDRFDETARRLFFDARGRHWPPGYRLANPAYAATLRRLALGGSTAFYEGDIAHQIVQAAAVAPAAKGAITLADLAAYQVIEREPVCSLYRGHRVCSMGPPSSGGHALAQALALLAPIPMGSGPAAAMAAAPLHHMAEATRLAFADRNWYLADPAFVSVPGGLLDRGYLAERRRLLSPFYPLAQAYPGTPPGITRQSTGRDATREAEGTSHISIIDAAGNAVAMTTTIEAGFGSGRMAAGFLLNNELTDFSFRPASREGRPIANRVEGGKRPRSSMSPTIVLGPDGQPVIVAGSAGGGRIIPYVLQTLVAVIDWKLDAAAALALPNMTSLGGQLELEAPAVGGLAGLGAPAGAFGVVGRALRLKPLGHGLAFETMTSGTQLIVRRPDGTLEGAADPRREGVAVGD